ncbi:MAG: DUF1294 domain-containing protein [Bacteroidales bacterium]|nr:DUF1294 domain-containing protein [Bacteroidales bacterium]
MWRKGGDMPNYTTILLLFLATLLLLAVLGGSVGAWLGMYVWRHKTQHRKFKYGVPLILLVQVAIMSACKSGIDFANIQTDPQFIIN